MLDHPGDRRSVSRSFSDYVRQALESFHRTFPGESLLDEDVSLSIQRKCDAGRA